MSSLKLAAVALPAVALLFASGAATADILLQTDASWKATPASPSSDDWYSSASFDDSAWQNATLLPDAGPYGIWSSGGQYSTTETQAWFRKTFTLAGSLSSASLSVGCDDDCEVYLNGVSVISDHNGYANSNTVSDLLPFLKVGTNLIALTVTDNYPVWGYNHQAGALIDGTFQPPVPEPGTVGLFGAGLAGIMALRRRKA